MKPHIKKNNTGIWSCVGFGYFTSGKAPQEAYERWEIGIKQALYNVTYTQSGNDLCGPLAVPERQSPAKSRGEVVILPDEPKSFRFTFFLLGCFIGLFVGLVLHSTL